MKYVVVMENGVNLYYLGITDDPQIADGYLEMKNKCYDYEHELKEYRNSEYANQPEERPYRYKIVQLSDEKYMDFCKKLPDLYTCSEIEPIIGTDIYLTDDDYEYICEMVNQAISEILVYTKTLASGLALFNDEDCIKARKLLKRLHKRFKTEEDLGSPANSLNWEKAVKRSRL